MEKRQNEKRHHGIRILKEGMREKWERNSYVSDSNSLSHLNFGPQKVCEWVVCNCK